MTQPNLSSTTRLVNVAGEPLTPSPTLNVPVEETLKLPVEFSLDPQTGSVAMIDRRTNAQVLFGASGIIGFRDAFGTLIQTTPDGKLIIKANSIELVTDTQTDGSPGVKIVELLANQPEDDQQAETPAETPET